MATRVKMLKLLQEVHGFATFANEHRQSRHRSVLLALGCDWFKEYQPLPQSIIRVNMKEQTDIPVPVRIKRR